MKRFLMLMLAVPLTPVSAFAQGTPAIAPTPAGGNAPLSQPILADPPASSVKPQAISPALSPEDCTGPCQAAAAELANRKDTAKPRGMFDGMRADPGAYSIVSVGSGLSTHKPMFILPATYSPDYTGKQTEVVFAISAKVQLFSTPVYFGYSQRSFWQLYDGARSRPFRETDYNPEIFYRFTPDPDKWHHWGADVGAEHESNGQDVPDSRSWNRLYFAPFWASGKTLVYLKGWYRLPEDKKKDPQDAKGDDNPDIERYTGYGEIHYQRQIGKGQVINTMVRFNTATGKGAINVNYTIPSKDGSIFYMAYLWQGYEESLLDYNDSVTRIGLGVAFAR